MPKSQKKLLILEVENITHMEKQLNITPGAECGSVFAADGIRNIVFDLDTGPPVTSPSSPTFLYF